MLQTSALFFAPAFLQTTNSEFCLPGSVVLPPQDVNSFCWSCARPPRCHCAPTARPWQAKQPNSRGAPPPRSKPGHVVHHQSPWGMLPHTPAPNPQAGRGYSPLWVPRLSFSEVVALAQNLGVQAAQEQPGPHGSASPARISVRPPGR
jgi:hypothetical protein